MKLTKFIATALAAAALSASSAFAVTYTDGDLIIGFRATGGQGSDIDYEVDLGQWQQFATGGSFATGSTVTLGLGNINADLVSIYGTAWYSRTDLLYSVSGVQRTGGTSGTASNTLFATNLKGLAGWTSRSVAGSSAPAGKISAMGTTFGQGTSNQYDGTLAGGDQVTSTNSSFAVIQPTALNQNTYRNNMPGGTNTTATQSFSTFTSGIEATQVDALTLYRLVPASGNPAGVTIGDFTVTSAGNVNFIAVPEPSTYALLGLGAVSLFLTVRRRKAVNS